MMVEQCRCITTNQLDSWSSQVRDLPLTPVCLVWLNHEPHGEEFHISITADADDNAIADMLETLGRLIRRQWRENARPRHDPK